MLNSFIEGFLLGAGAAVPIGPINILIINEALSSYRNAVFIGMGAMSADATYLLSILFGIVGYVKNNTKALSVIGVIGSLFLIYLSYDIFKNRSTKLEIHKKTVKKTSIIKSYLKGYSLTLLNPYTVGFWLSVAAYVATKKLNPPYTIGGLLSAITLWITIMPFIVHKTRNVLSPRAMKLINIISSAVLLFFGVSMFIGALSISKI